MDKMKDEDVEMDCFIFLIILMIRIEVRELIINMYTLGYYVMVGLFTIVIQIIHLRQKGFFLLSK